MKKWLFSSLGVAVVCSVVSCGNGKSSTEKTSTSNQQPREETTVDTRPVQAPDVEATERALNSGSSSSTSTPVNVSKVGSGSSNGGTGSLDSGQEMHDHPSPDQQKIDSIKNSYPDKK